MDDPELFELVMALPLEQREPAVRDACDGDTARTAHLLELVGLASRGETTVVDPEAPELVAAMITRLERGARIARYVIVAFLGQGASGEVYEAFDLELARRCALKLLRRDREIGRDDERRFKREAQALAQIDHANVVRIFDVGTHEGRRYLTMELIDGTSLRPWVTGAQGRGWREVLQTLLPAARGLQAAHAAGIVHRDFKPENVMRGAHGRVVVTDFGIARPIDGEPSSRRALELVGVGTSGSESGDSSSTATAIGTPSYMAPEQFHGRVTPSSDQFAFCRVLLEALGEHPRGSVDTAPIGSPIALEAAHARGPGWLRRVVARGLAAEPEQRFTDMGALIRELERHSVQRRWVVGSLGVAVVLAAFVPMLSRAEAHACDGWSESTVLGAFEPTWTALGESAESSASVEAARAQVSALRASSEWSLREWSLGRTETCRQHATAMLDAETARVRDRCFGAWESELRRGLQWSVEHPEALVSPRLLQELPREPGRCLWVEPAARGEVEIDPGVRTQIDIALMEAKGLRILGDFSASEVRTREALALAEAVGSDRDRAEILQRLGTLAARNRSWSLSLDLLRRSIALAERTGADRLASRGYVELASTSALASDGASENGREYASLARAKLARIDDSDDELAADMEIVDADIALLSGEYALAEAGYRRGADMFAAMSGTSDFRVFAARANVARAVSAQGRHREAIEMGERALAHRISAIGEHHPFIVDDRRELGAMHARAAEEASDAESSETHLSRAMALVRESADAATQTYGRHSLPVARSLVELTSIRLIANRIDERMARDVADFVDAFEGTADGEISTAELLHASRIARNAYHALARWPDARHLSDRIVELGAPTEPPRDERRVEDELLAIAYEIDAGDRTRAAEHLQQHECRYPAADATDRRHGETLEALHQQLETAASHDRETR